MYGAVNLLGDAIGLVCIAIELTVRLKTCNGIGRPGAVVDHGLVSEDLVGVVELVGIAICVFGWLWLRSSTATVTVDAIEDCHNCQAG